METIGKTTQALLSRPTSMPALPNSNGSNRPTAETVKYAKILCGWCDPREVNDPATFANSIELVLSAYPPDVQRTVADPRSGALDRVKLHAKENREWLAFVEIVRRACEGEVGPRRRASEWNQRTEAQLAERERLDREAAENPPIDLKAKYGPTYGIEQSPPEPHINETTEALAARRNKRMADFSKVCIEREYRERGEEPVLAGGMLVSRSLIESVREQNRNRWAIPRTED